MIFGSEFSAETDKTALITGGTSGIGAEFAKEYAKKGYNLIITGRRVEVLEKVAQNISDTYRKKVEMIVIELSDKIQLEAFVSTLLVRTDIEVLVNAAGFGVNSLFAEANPDLVEKMIIVHDLVPLRLIRAVLPSILANDTGTIINVASDGAYLLLPRNAVYASSKAFLKTFSETLHLELKDTNLQVQVLCPGLTKTDFHEKMGMTKKRQKNHGMVKWSMPDEIVRASFDALRKHRVICIPKKSIRMLIACTERMPRNLFYAFMSSLGNRMFPKKKIQTQGVQKRI
ncbi:SDR family NAD(P)-dependent oxidoreductase [uncultured Sphaerochaeta sp.]|uniref:SDR family NAD(P)-dependent oxidoreductase n=1 Tax=uncultured Sphaerochaeta sp. TaxID=886478 RepID=UPI002A0A1F43|nr:SDR family NAD(P)-dependent oxidoreductase [uncultured Sphaerochaeta sp.]